jgi:hypothetical protein
LAVATKDPEITDLTIVVLREIRDQVTGLRGDVHELRDEQRTTNQRLTSLEHHFTSLEHHVAGLEEATIDGFTGVRRELDKVNQRLDGLRDIAGDATRLPAS